MAEILLAAVTEAVFAILLGDLSQQPGLAKWRDALRGGSAQKQAFRRALAKAYEVFRREYPNLVASLFDEHLLEKPEVARELAKILMPSQDPSVHALEQAWRSQFYGEPTIELNQPLSFFLDTLEIEVKAQWELKHLVDSRAFEQLYSIAQSDEEQTVLLKQILGVLTRSRQMNIPFLAPPLPNHLIIGRDELLSNLKERLFAGGTLTLCALHGMPGVGKTALALALAHDHDVLAHFEDGVLWAGLGREGDALVHLSTWGKALGIPSEEIANLSDVGERARTVHNAISLRRILLVIDDAWQVDAALALKVGGPNCAHVVTTRLVDLGKHFSGTGFFEVHELLEDDALRLLEHLAPTVVATEPDNARALVQAVGGLPLALILVGSSLSIEAESRQPNSLQAALNRLKSVEERLRLEMPQAPLESHPSLPAGTPFSLLAAIEISDDALDEKSRTALRSLSVFPPKPNTFSEEAAIAVSSTPVGTLDKLADYGLLERAGVGRYTLHQTISDYAGEALAKDTEEQQGSRVRAAQWYFKESSLMNKRLQAEYRYQEAELLADNTDLSLSEADSKLFQEALDWFGHERVNLVAVVKAAYEAGEWRLVWKLALNLIYFFDIHNHWSDWELTHRLALDAVRQDKQRRAEAGILSNLGEVYDRQGNWDQAIKMYGESLEIFKEQGDPEGQSVTLNNLGHIYHLQGRLDDARKCFEQDLSLCRTMRTRYHLGEGIAQTNLGRVYAQLGDWEEAKKRLEEGLSIRQHLRDRQGEGIAWMGLGEFYAIQSRWDDAAKAYEASLHIFRDLEDTHDEGLALIGLGDIDLQRGLSEKAIDHWREGLTKLHPGSPEYRQVKDKLESASKS